MSKLGRNDPCYCGSGKKYKHCCLGKTPRVLDPPVPSPADAPPLLLPPDDPYDPYDDDLDAVVQELLDEEANPEPETPLDRAYDLSFDAWQAIGAERVDLARKALAESPDCVDAYNVLAAEATTPEAAITLYEQALATAERILGPDWWERNPTRDWTEPLEVECVVDACRGLARAFMDLGRDEEAVDQLRTLVTFDPEDYDAVRYDYLEALLRAGRDAEAMDLLDAYPATVSALWPYARALLKFRRDGDTLWPRRALVSALADNPIVATHLLGKTPPPDPAQPRGFLDPNADAVDTARQLADVWHQTPGATDWLRTFVDAGPDAHLDATERGDGPILCMTPTDALGYIRCPRCDRKTKPRRRETVVLIEPDDRLAVRVACRHCEDCNVLSFLTRDIHKTVESAARSRGLDLTGRDRLALGIIDPGAVDQRPAAADEAVWIDDHLHRWRDEIRLIEQLQEQLAPYDPYLEGVDNAPDAAGVIDVPYSLRSR